MTKLTESGLFWEWRAFGRVTDELRDRIMKYPKRYATGIRSDDLYLITDTSDQNVKVRQGEWLKLKIQHGKGDHDLELWEENPRYLYRFPVPRSVVRETAGLLRTTLPPWRGQEVDSATLINLFTEGDPPARLVQTMKERLQLIVGEAWVEIATVQFAGATVDTIGIQGAHPMHVVHAYDCLRPGPELEPMNYIVACRRFTGQPGA